MLVRKLRLQRGWTQAELSEFSGLSIRSIQRIEQGRSYSMESAKALASVFEIDVARLTDGGEEMDEEKQAVLYVKGLKEFWSHLFMYVIFVVAFMATVGPGNPMVLWGSIGWGLGVIFHGLVAYEVINIFGPKWEKKMIEKRLGRKL